MVRHHLLGIAAALACMAAPAAAQQARPLARPALERGWVGISVEVLTTSASFERGPSVTVTDVSGESPAARAGIRIGDVLLSINGAQAFPRDLRAGDTVRVVLQRDGKRHQVTLRAEPRPAALETVPAWVVTVRPDSIVDRMYRAMDSLRIRLIRDDEGHVRVLAGASGGLVPGELPDGWTVERVRPFDFHLRGEGLDSLRAQMERAALPATEREGRLGVVRLRADPEPGDVRAGFRPFDPYVLGRNRAAGAEVVDLRPELAEYFGVDGGVLVVDVPDGTPAALSGIQPGDVLVEVGTTPVRSIQDLRTALSARGELPVTVVRKGARVQLLLGH